MILRVLEVTSAVPPHRDSSKVKIKRIRKTRLHFGSRLHPVHCHNHGPRTAHDSVTMR